MAKQTINIGTGELTGDGESIRSAFSKINNNFDELYAADSATFDGNYNNLTNKPTLFSGSYNDLTNKPTIPADISDLTDTTNLLSSGTGDITFTAATVSAGTNDEIIIQAQDADGFATARLNLEPEFSTAKLSAFSSESVDTFTLTNGDFTTGVWQNNGFGNGVVSFTGAQGIGDLFQNTLFSLSSNNVTIQINSEPAFTWNGGASGAGTATPGFGTNPIVPASPITVTSITFTYRSESYIGVNYDNQEIRLDAQNAGIRMDANNSIQMFGDSDIELQAATTFRIAASEDIEIGTGSAYAVRVSGGDFVVSASDDVDIRGADSFRLRNDSAVAPIRIITDDDNNSYTWAFNPNGTVTFPDATVQTTAYTGPENPFNQDLDTTDSPNFVNIGLAGIVPPGEATPYATIGIAENSDLYISLSATETGSKIFEFGSDGKLLVPGKFTVDDNISGGAGDRLYLGGEDAEGTAWIEIPNVTRSATSPIDISNPNGGGVKVATGAGNWLFDDTRFLHFPSSTDDDYNIGESIDGFNIRSDLSFGIATNFTTNAKYWLFDTDGSLTIPGNIKSEDAINIDINLSDSTLRRWTFGADGVLNIPNGIISPNTIEISNTSAGVLQDINIYSADNILLQGADRLAAGEPEGGDINIYAGDGAPDNGVLGSSSGGDLEIFAGRGGNGSATGFAGPGGNIDIQAGNGGSDNGGGGGDGGNISISAGDATNAAQDRGHISITSGAGGDETTNGGYVEITIPSAGTHPGGSWLFSGNGLSFEVPGNAEIVCVNNGDLTIGTYNNPTNIRVGNTLTTQTYTWAFDDDGTLTFPDSTVQSTAFTLSPTLNVLKIDDGVHEKYQELADATGTVTHDCSAGHIFYHASPDANWTVNLTNLNLSVSYATTVTIIIDQGGTGYYPNALQIGGSAQTINWQGNATPTPSSNRHDVVTFSILAFAGGYTVFGQMTGF